MRGSSKRLAACAQLVNCLNALFMTHEDKFIVTPNYHVFDLYAAHMGAEGIRTEFSAPRVHYDRDGKPAYFAGLNGSWKFEPGVNASWPCTLWKAEAGSGPPT